MGLGIGACLFARCVFPEVVLVLEGSRVTVGTALCFVGGGWVLADRSPWGGGGGERGGGGSCST